MSTLREAAQQALEAWDGGDVEWFKRAYTAMENLRAALAQQDEPVWMHPWPPVRAQQAEPQTIDDAMQQPRAMAQAYESGYKSGAAAEREAIIQAIPGGHIVDPQWVCDMIRARGNT